jgi:heme-degrading monooxygenase HmoA
VRVFINREGERCSRVITAQAGAEGFDGTIRFAEQQLPGARQQPGFKGYYVLTDAETGKLLIISLWETREQMDAVTAGAGPSGIQDQHNPATGLTAMHLETYEVKMHI